MALKSKDNDGKRGRFSENESLNQSKSPLGASIPTNNSGCVQHKAIQGNMNNERRGIQPISSRDGSTDKTGNKSGEGESSTTTTTTTTTTVPTNSLQPQSPKSMPEVAQTEEDQEAEKDGSSSSKKDKSNRRKGKWTVEEEEYTSRIIQLFSTGVLILPEGATLRSYLADKLNCDPMRITKKFTGACCLGRRVYHQRDRPRATPAEVEMAKAELDHLEQRFRLRVEREQFGLPPSRRQELLLAQAQNGVSTLSPMQKPSATANISKPWLPNYTAAGTSVNTPLLMNLPGNRSIQAVPAAQYPFGSIPSVAGHLVLPNAAESAQPDPSAKILKNIYASWAWAQAAASLSPPLSAQAAASLSPALSQLAFSKPASVPSSIIEIQQQQQKDKHNQQQKEERQRKQRNEEHKRQLRAAYEESKKEDEQRQLLLAANEERLRAETAKTTSSSSQSTSCPPQIPPSPELSAAQQLQRSYAAHLESLKEKEEVPSKDQLTSSPVDDEDKRATSAERTMPENKLSRNTASKTEVLSSNAADSSSNGREDISMDIEVSSDGAKSKYTNSVQQGNEQPRPTEAEDTRRETEEAGTILWGFLSSLRDSYEDAVEQKTSASGNTVNNKHALEEKKKRNSSDSNPIESQTSSKPRPAASTGSSSTALPKVSKFVNRAGKRFFDTRLASETPQQDTVQNTSAPQFQTTSPASVTDTSMSRCETSSGASSQPTESSSSLEDSDSKSDKASSSSSSEESEKECTLIRASRGPPRKRWKSCKQVKEFTTQNVMEHSKRMSQEFDGAVGDGKSIEVYRQNKNRKTI